MEDYTTWSADKLRRMHLALRYSSMLREGDVPVEAQYYAIQAELDRRCQIFSWAESDVIIRVIGPVYVQNDIYEGIYGGAEQTIHFYGISNPAEFSALLSYFISKPRTA